LPEGTLPLTQAVTYLAMAHKSNTVLTSYMSARAAVTENGPLPVPLHLRMGPTPLIKSLGYRAGYQYPHNFEGSYVPEDYLPDALRGARFYNPSQTGFERELSERVAELRRQMQSASGNPYTPSPSTKLRTGVGRRKPTEVEGDPSTVGENSSND